MSQSENLKEIVKQKYGEIANQKVESNVSSCCGATSCGNDGYTIMSDKYDGIEGYQSEADLGLGCGLPTQYAKINLGDTVVDLGSGAGNDVFVARTAVGANGLVIGIDFTENMISKAKENAARLSFSNVNFRLGDIEDMPITSNFANVVISNCVLNLVPNKHKVFSEIYRVLKPGGHFSISDIVLEGELPEKWQEVAEMYAGCVSGAIQRSEYLSIIHEAGFENVTLQKEKAITIPDEILANYFNQQEINAFKNSNAKIVSLTIYAEKLSKDDRNCCAPESGCC
ncbi:MAG: arsenite methyltransferase [Chitinophagaceae bacterium]|nr:arsenite methyltransferase [Chitinophagaceae bacterium]